MELFHVKCGQFLHMDPALPTEKCVSQVPPIQCLCGLLQRAWRYGFSHACCRKSSFPRVWGPKLDFETKQTLKVVDTPTFYKYWSNQT